MPPAPNPDAPNHRAAARRRRARSIGGTLLSLALTMLGLLLVTFIIGRVMPIDPVLKVVGDRASQAQYDAAYQAMGLDQPLYVQFVRYLGDVLTGDFGRSISTGQLVVDDIKRVFPATFELATLGTLIGVLIGVPLGVIAAARQGGIVPERVPGGDQRVAAEGGREPGNPGIGIGAGRQVGDQQGDIGARLPQPVVEALVASALDDGAPA